MERGEFGNLKLRLLGALSSLECLAVHESSAEACAKLKNKLDSERFVVVVVGAFKRGKTTLVNALLGSPVLPTAVVPLTSVVTTIGYGEHPDAAVSFLDGHSEVVALDTVAAYVTERENPANRLAVDQVLISYPSPYLADGVVLVDTPGVGSVYAHNTRTAYDFLPHADAAIFVTSADPPVSAAELEFLADCRGFASRMFFVLNKVDYLSGADQAEALDFTTAALTDALGPEPKVYPLSARLALQAAQGGDEVAREGSGLPAFERDFRGFLLRDRARLLLASIAKAGLKVTADEGNRIAVAEQAARLPIDELTRRAERMEALFAEARAQRQDVRALLRRDIEVLTARIDEDLATFAARTRPELTQRGQLYLETTADAGLGSLDERIRQLITRSVEAWREAEEPTVAAELERRLSRSLAATDELLRRTVALCAGIMEVTLTPVTAPRVDGKRSRFSLDFERAPTSTDGLLPDLTGWLPRGLGRRLLVKELAKRVPELLDRQCGRLRWDFVQRLESLVRELNRELDDHLAATLATLGTGLDQALSETGTAKAAAAWAAQASGELRAGLEQAAAELAGLLAVLDVGDRRDLRSA